MSAVRRHGPGLLLLAYGAAFAVAAFGRGLPAFDDHPGQFFRLWHALERSLPDGRWTADWNPDWWGGYPELQFYPPGFALAGAAIRLLALWQPSAELVYQLLCGVIFLLPAFATFALVRSVLGDGWLALPPAFLALTLSAELRGGVEESLRWGMLTSRLSVGLLPLLALALRPWIDAGRPPVWAAGPCPGRPRSAWRWCSPRRSCSSPLVWCTGGAGGSGSISCSWRWWWPACLGPGRCCRSRSVPCGTSHGGTITPSS